MTDRTRGWGRRLWLWLPVVLWMALIFAGSNRTNARLSQSPAVDQPARKSAHVIEYTVLGLLLARGFLAGARPGGARPYQLAVAVGGIYAVSDELHQWFVPTRAASPRDVLIDVVALTVAVLLLWLWQRHRRPAPTRSPHQS
jgi:VanZ family protein